MARLAANLARLEDEGFISPIVDEAYSTIVARTNGSGAVKRAGSRKLGILFAIGAPPAGHNAANGVYDSLDDFLVEGNDDTFRARVRVYAEVCMTSEALSRLPGSGDFVTAWENAIDGNVTIDALEQSDAFDALRERVSQKMSSNQAAGAGPAAGGVGGAGAAGGATGTFTAHRPELPKLPTETMTNAKTYRHFKTMLAASPNDQTHTALRIALGSDGDYADSWRLWLEQNQQQPAYNPAQESLHVREFLQARMKELNPEIFAVQDLEDAKEFVQTTQMPLTDYLRKKHALMQSAQLSGNANGHCDPTVANERAWCDMALKDMLARLQVKMREHITSVELVTAGGIPGYDGHGHITQWQVFTHAAIKIAVASRLDPKSGPNSKNAADDGKQKAEKDLSTSQKTSLRNQRRTFFAQAMAMGPDFITPCGHCMMTRDFFHGEGGAVSCHPAFGQSDAAKRKLPPMLVDSSGRKAPNSSQPCRFAWEGKVCPRGDKCYFEHVTKEEFFQRMKEGRTDLVPQPPRAPAAQAGSNPLVPQSGAVSQEGALNEARVAALLVPFAERIEAQVSVLAAKVEQSSDVHQRIDQIDQQLRVLEDAVLSAGDKAAAKSKSDPAAVKAEAARKETQRQRLVAMAEANRKEIEEAASNMCVFAPGSEEYWELEEVREQASILVAKATSLYEESHGPSSSGKRGSAQPIIELALGAVKLRAMVDSGCAPTALMPADKVTEIEKQIGSNCMGPLVLFEKAKVISGVDNAPDSVRVVGSRQLQFAHPQSGRPLTVSVGLMQGGNCGVADLMIGNYHMTEDWGAVMDFDNMRFVVQRPEDKGKPLGFEMLHAIGSSKKKAGAAKSHAVNPRR